MSILSKKPNKQSDASEDDLETDTDKLCPTCPSREHCVQVNPACWDVAESYRRLFENAIEGIFRTTPDGHYISVNPGLVKLYGYESANDLITSLTAEVLKVRLSNEKRGQNAVFCPQVKKK